MGKPNKTKLSAYDSSFLSFFLKACAAILPSIVYAIFSYALRRKLKMCFVEIDIDRASEELIFAQLGIPV